MELKSRLLARLPLAVIIPALLFACAGSLRFWQAWVWLAVFVFPMLALMFYLYRHDPKVLERRMRVHEKIGEQKIYQIAASLAYPVCLVIAGLDYRFGWSRNLLGPVPVWLTLIADGGVLSGLLLVFEVFRVNRFAARTIEVEAGQIVVSTGPYRLVRHPMYLGGAVTLLSYPLALASWVAWPLSALIIPVLVLRLLGEENFLRRELPGYSEYCLRTRYRLIPLIW